MASDDAPPPGARRDPPPVPGGWWALFDAAPVAHALIALPGGLVAANQAFCDLFAVDPAALDTIDPLQLTHPDDRQGTHQAFEEMLDGRRRSFETDKRYVRGDGREFWGHLHATALAGDDGRMYVFGTCVDISASVTAREALEERAEWSAAQERIRHRYEQMLAQVADRVSLLAPDGSPIEEHGPGRRRLVRPPVTWTPAETVERCHPDERESLVSSLARLLAEPGATLLDQYRFRDDDGGWMSLEFEGVNRSDDPAIGATVLTTRDVTDREEAARELAEARDQALTALEARSEFVATVSHELRTPIHGILGLAELLAGSVDAQTRSLAGAILRSAESLRLVVDDILDLSKLEAGGLELVLGPIDTAELRDDLATVFGAQAAAKEIDFVVDVEHDYPEWVWGDGLRVRQVLTNLIGNAVKFTEEGEVRVTLTTEPAAPGAELPMAVRIEVRDTGIGIPTELQAGLFDPFPRAHARTTARYGGTGLGLVITGKLVEALAGTMSFDSEPGRGTTFVVTLPHAPLDTDEDGRPILPEEPTPVADGAALGATDADDAESRAILVVEDNPVNQLLVARQLEVLGYEARVVADGESALARYAERRPLAIFMDLRLPGMDGLETARQIRALEARTGEPRTPMVAMTASGSALDRQQAERIGMDGFVTKPAGLEAVRNALAPLVGGDHDDGGGDDPASLAAVDTSVADQLVGELGDPELVAHLCDLFVRELPTRVAAIRAAFDEGGDTGAATHALRSAALTLGATALIDLCERLDRAVDAGRRADSDADDDLLVSLDPLADATAAQLASLARRYREGAGSTA